MIRLLQSSRYVRVAGVLIAGLAVLTATDGFAASKRAKRPITKPKFDPKAEKVELFEGIKKGFLKVKMIPKDSTGGKLFVENKTGKPLTVSIPPGIVGVQVLKQFDGGLDGGGFDGGGFDPGGGGGGGAQPVGGGLAGGGGGGLDGGLDGGLGFSIPPERIVAVPYKSVCLAHGRPEPRSKMIYRVVKVEEFTKDPVLQELIKLVGTGKIDQKSAQAATWHLTNKMSWQQLAAKRVKHLGGRQATPYFRPAQLRFGMRLVAVAQERSRETAKAAGSSAADKPTGRVPSRTRSVSPRTRTIRTFR